MQLGDTTGEDCGKGASFHLYNICIWFRIIFVFVYHLYLYLYLIRCSWQICTTGEDCGGTSFTTASDFGPRPLLLGVRRESLVGKY